MSRAYIGIGSNLGDRQQNIDRALEKLKTRKNIQLGQVSSVIETEPMGDTKQPKFLNACCRIDTTLYPDELLSALKSIEREMGRDRDSAPKKLSREEQLMALEQGKDISRPAREDAPVTAAVRKDKWAPRVIDLDILLYDDIIMRGNNLIIPHKFLHERLFALKPLAELAPELTHPVLKKPVKELLSECRQKDAGNQENKMPLQECVDTPKTPAVIPAQPVSIYKTLLTMVRNLLKIPHKNV